MVFGQTNKKEIVMIFQEIVAPTTKELFITELQRKILTGEIKIGDRLPTERELERTTKVSRTIINSALTELARIGFVRIVPRHGVFVGDYIRNGNVDTLISIMNFNGGKLDRKNLDSIMSYRKHNEMECAYLAAKNRSEDDIAILRDLYQQIKESSDVLSVSKLKNEFHHAIYCASGNTIYPLVFNSFTKLAQTFNETIYRNFGCTSATKYLPELIEAIALQDGNMARSIMEKLAALRFEQLNQCYFED